MTYASERRACPSCTPKTLATRGRQCRATAATAAPVRDLLVSVGMRTPSRLQIRSIPRSASQLEFLVQCRHFHLGVLQVPGKVSHRLLARRGPGRCARRADLPVPGEQLGLVGMGGEAVDRVNAGAFTGISSPKMRTCLGAVDDLAGQRAAGREADEDDARVLRARDCA